MSPVTFFRGPLFVPWGFDMKTNFQEKPLDSGTLSQQGLCYHCAKIIKGRHILNVSAYFGVTAYHTKCYVAAEVAGAKALGFDQAQAKRDAIARVQ